MIELAGVTKHFPGAARPAVDNLTLTIATGQVCVLIGPSGCGKTTTLRMVNRLVDPDAGTIAIDGRDVTSLDVVALRRGIGYVIQQGGLFPHWTIARNIATVPALLGWEPARIAARVDELLALVGMEPAQFRHRHPRELSGGQRQRVGVARALAGDPPVLLMDEPFGALDPITRSRLQDELLAILRHLAKTVVLVTHDIDEALRLADRIAVLREGCLVQHATPAALLAHPADDFVASFVGSDRALRRLALVPVRELLEAGPVPDVPGATIAVTATLRDALAQMLAQDTDRLAVFDREHAIGTISLAALRAYAARGSIDIEAAAP